MCVENSFSCLPHVVPSINKTLCSSKTNGRKIVQCDMFSESFFRCFLSPKKKASWAKACALLSRSLLVRTNKTRFCWCKRRCYARLAKLFFHIFYAFFFLKSFTKSLVCLPFTSFCATLFVSLSYVVCATFSFNRTEQWKIAQKQSPELRKRKK